MKLTTPTPPSEMRNIIITAVLCTLLLFAWQVFYVKPQEDARRAMLSEQANLQQKPMFTPQGDVILPQRPEGATDSVAPITPVAQVTREEALEDAPRVSISSGALHGSINLRGLRFDDLTLVRHRVDTAEDSPEVVLLTPAQHENRYFAQLGWLAAQGSSVKLPDGDTLWKADASELTPAKPLLLTWNNGQGLEFRVQVSLDENYLFTLTQEVRNTGGAAVNVMPYGLINRAEPHDSSRFTQVLHHGPIGVFNDELTEVNYEELRDDKEKFSYAETNGWLGIADKYWLTAFIPTQDERFSANFQHVSPQGQDRTQVDFLAPAQAVAAGGTASYVVHLFAGAKELDVLESYREDKGFPLFDRALDFGVLYFLTKPILIALDYFYVVLGNFGLAIMLFVVLLKLALFPLSNKSYRSMAQMRVLQPQIEEVRKQYGHDKMKMQQEVMAIWQRERVNPVSGCLPMLIQIPIFFALYKMLLVSIEMRHAPFYGWVSDLSAPDPTNIFTLFGLLEWNPPSMLHIGLWPIIMAATMVLQQKFNPKPSDPIQAKVIGWLPYIFLVLFASFPAGLLIYWAWNNTLSVVQQAYITRSFERHQKRKASKLELADEKGSA